MQRLAAGKPRSPRLGKIFERRSRVRKFPPASPDASESAVKPAKHGLSRVSEGCGRRFPMAQIWLFGRENSSGCPDFARGCGGLGKPRLRGSFCYYQPVSGSIFLNTGDIQNIYSEIGLIKKIACADQKGDTVTGL
ncbi:hypothetical protein [Caulobacter hibisci]|uniref:Uncharacterized protein n=1 Tax=Caulobacter hibisci TaxID=2035993 RepID=A0ABS0SZE2_9CAUL|nr:hypothetical protein [Caulobacter hibisci]MBI1685002.1 hypothetical protein [Caulobacter hibisci]